MPQGKHCRHGYGRRGGGSKLYASLAPVRPALRCRSFCVLARNTLSYIYALFLLFNTPIHTPQPHTHSHIRLHLQCRFTFVNLWWKKSHDNEKCRGQGAAKAGFQEHSAKIKETNKLRRLSP